MSMVTVSCQGITKYFGENEQRSEILKGIDFLAHEQEMILLMGPSGSGKTTLLSIIGGILTQSAGTCEVLDKAINELPEAEQTRFRGKNIGFLFQHFALVPTLTALENVAIPLLLNHIPEDQAYAEAARFLETLGLVRQQSQSPTMLSGGEQQRVALARACILRPRILLCDEPTSFLDRSRGKQIMELLQNIKTKTQCTVIVVTHDPRIIPFADRIYEMEDGYLKLREASEVEEYA